VSRQGNDHGGVHRSVAAEGDATIKYANCREIGHGSWSGRWQQFRFDVASGNVLDQWWKIVLAMIADFERKIGIEASANLVAITVDGLFPRVL